MQPPSKENNIDLCSYVCLLASYKFSYVFSPLFTSNNYPEKKQVVCFVDRGRNMVFLISHVAR